MTSIFNVGWCAPARPNCVRYNIKMNQYPLRVHQLIRTGPCNISHMRTLEGACPRLTSNVPTCLLVGDFRFEFEYAIEYENNFSILVFRLHIITSHTHFIPCASLSTSNQYEERGFQKRHWCENRKLYSYSMSHSQSNLKVSSIVRADLKETPDGSS